MAVEQEDSGIYYPIGDAIPIQLVIVPKLSKEHNYWLNNLRNDLKAGSEIKKITESGLKSIDNTTITHSSVIFLISLPALRSFLKLFSQ